MAITARQSALFAGEVWDTLYQAFPKINFNATDPVSINRALRDYIRITYPEQFNDWIVSSEFVAIIDLLAWLAGTLAFKTDIAARENFIDTAEARESILRLARFLSYNPSRCVPASGMLKITEVSTDDAVFDSFGTNLANTPIIWNDPNNSNWYDQFTLVLNNSFVNTNPFGVPIKAGTALGASTELYRVNGLYNQSNFGFNANVSGVGMDFEICNGDYVNGTQSERAPNPNNAFQFYYLSDGNGNSSIRTGFFLLFKQGSTQRQVFNIAVPIENQLLNIGGTNVNQTDVWVQTIDDTGKVSFDWIKVPAIPDSNTTFNSIPASQRNIFSVLTRDNDQITIRFSDGRFGNAPFGNIQVIYRVSNGLQYQINPLEIDHFQVPIIFSNATGSPKTLFLTFSLLETVVNAAPAETIEQIRQRAPQIYSTQNRMVSGEDYNAYPLSSNLAVKIKAVNRVFAGQSRYMHDPTGTYQDQSLFGDDGIFFREVTDSYFEVPQSLNKNATEIVEGYVKPLLRQYTVAKLISDVLLQNTRYVIASTTAFIWTDGTLIDVSGANLTWIQSTADLFQTTGSFSARQNLIQPGASVQFNLGNVPTWVGVVDIQGSVNAIPLPHTAGPVTLSQEIPNGTVVLAILPAPGVALPDSVASTITTNLEKKLSFSLWYDYSNHNSVTGPTWVVGAANVDFGSPSPALNSNGQLLIMNVNYVSAIWRINSRGLRHVFESIDDVEWYDNGKRALDQLTGEANPDLIRIMRINHNPHDPRGYAQPRDYNTVIDRLWLYPDGTAEPRRTTATFFDGNGDGVPDDPDLYYKIVSPIPQNTYLFWTSKNNQPYDTPLYTVKVYDTETLRQGDIPPNGTIGFQVSSASSYLLDETFWEYTGSATGWQQCKYNTYRVEQGRGLNVAAIWVTTTGNVFPQGDNLAFHWKHYAPSDYRIDPAISNIHDIFVLTFVYNTAIRQWIANGADVSNIPQPATEFQLRRDFASLEEFKMFSDAIVWRPVNYKFLFGNGADEQLRAQFKVIRLANTDTSDGTIKSNVITAINTYFDVTRWDFGETFYFSELAAYIHQQMVGLISSVVIVPLGSDTAFGDGFEVSCRADEIFVSTAQVSDILLIQSNTATNLRIR